jgi:hypothetical protein
VTPRSHPTHQEQRLLLGFDGYPGSSVRTVGHARLARRHPVAIESPFATARLRQPPTNCPGSRTEGLLLDFQLLAMGRAALAENQRRTPHPTSAPPGLCSAAAFKRRAGILRRGAEVKPTATEPSHRLQEPQCFRLLAAAPYPANALTRGEESARGRRSDVANMLRALQPPRSKACGL